jgi:hypothetical protein
MKKYTIADLLVDTQYKNSLGQIGTIVRAEKREDVYFPDNTEAYAVEYHIPKYGNSWATVAVEVSD